MFGTFTLTALFASASILLVHADVSPNVPGPGVVYKQGETCHIEWNADTGSTTAWKNMAIQLMTGDNFNMVHLTTVATGLDGTINGNFDHPCPAVIPNSAIYFYQFTAAGATTKQWTTRFAIASATGATTPPANPTQPGTNAPIPWGTGALADPSKAVPPPPSAGPSTGTTTPAPPPVSNGASSFAPAPGTTLPQNPGTFLSSNTLTSRFTTVTTGPTPSAVPTSSRTTNSTSGASAGTKDNAAVGMHARVWQAAVALCASAVTFVVFL